MCAQNYAVVSSNLQIKPYGTFFPDNGTDWWKRQTDRETETDSDTERERVSK